MLEDVLVGLLFPLFKFELSEGFPPKLRNVAPRIPALCSRIRRETSLDRSVTCNRSFWTVSTLRFALSTSVDVTFGLVCRFCGLTLFKERAASLIFVSSFNFLDNASEREARARCSYRR